ncbi:putative ribonuclease H-like domain-containing protein [Tanacetum coccineum]
MPVQTRRQLATDPEMCMFALTVSIVEPKNIKDAMADSAWIEAMQEELHQFDRLKVWELVDKPFGKMIIKLKCHKVVRLGINPMIQPEPEDLPKDNPKLEIAVLSEVLRDPTPDFKLTDESHVLLKVPRKDNMYSVDLKNVVPQGASLCKCKTMNKLVRGNLVRGLPSKRFEINQTCVACQKGKQHRASCIENLIDLKVKVIRCDNGTEFKNRVMNQFCEIKGIKREFSVARTPQQNRVAERKNRTLIEAAKTMLADLNLPTTSGLKQKPALSFMRPFGCPVTILNTIDHLGKFDGKADEGFFVGYSTNSKAFKVFNSKTRIIEENLHVQFSDNTPNIVESGPNWLFDIHALTKSMNYKPVVVGNQYNGNAGTKACDDAGKARMETIKDYILLPMWPADPLFSQNSKDSPDAGFKSSGEEEKMDVEDPWNKSKALGKDSEDVDDPNMPELEDIVYSDVGAEADMNNLNTWIPSAYSSLIGKIEEKSMFINPPGILKIQTTLIIYKVERALYGLLQAPKLGSRRNGSFDIISQDKYMTEILKKFGFSDVKTASTPMETHKPLLKDTDGEDVDEHLDSKSSPKNSTIFYAVKMIFRYLKGGCQFLGCRLISWQCKKQTVVANSTTEAEYIAASNCCGQVLWIQNQLLDYGYNFMQTKIHIAIISTICPVKKTQFHSKTKHIEIRHHFIRDSYKKKLIQMIKIHIDQNVVDLLTKAFDVSRFQYLIASIGMLNL